MRKNLSFILCLLLLVFAGNIAVPLAVGYNAASKIQEAAKAQNVDVNVSAFPGFMVLAGKLDKLDIIVDQANFNDLQVEKLELHGENVDADFSAMNTRDGSAIRSADKLELTGVITQQALQDLLVKRLDKVENIQTYITPEGIGATGQIKLLGRMADVTLKGSVVPKNGGLYFHMTRLDIRNAALGQAVLGDLFGDILLFDLYRSPVRADIDDVVQQDGQVTIRATGKAAGEI